MDTYAAATISKEAASREAKFRVFDWDKAATIIRDQQPNIAEAGLSLDMEWTSGTIYEDGKPKTNGYTYLASNWAIPVLVLDDGVEIECWIWEGENGSGWNENTKWPDSALAIVNSGSDKEVL